MYEVTVKASFSAAHALRGHPGVCANLHGHNWGVEAVFASEHLDKQGMVLDFADVSEELVRVTGMLDHKVINEVPPFDKANPTAENLAEWIFSELKGNLKFAPKSVTVHETDKTSATFLYKE